ncbi:MAG: serine protease [Deltaproteobacteria bacterium]|nr:serine protease [Deltaproteobacteria bacterium]MCL5276723.1 serine protease [Deltaproteobacteria bacterium]
MPTWGELLKELQEVQEKTNLPPFDIVRRKYLNLLKNKTGRDVILYATKWTVPGASPNDIAIVEEDVQGFMEVIHGLSNSALDLIIHSPGGSAEVTEALVSYIRTKFTNVRVIIPQAAMSAATMLACAANIIMMGKHSSLGPIDPQFILSTQIGIQSVPAQAILDQFDKAKEECQDPKLLGRWLPILSQYGPALLVQCENAIDLSETLLEQWLEQYMFSGEQSASEKAQKIAQYLSDHKRFKSHARHIPRDKAKELGLNIEDLEKDQVTQDLILSVFHATTHTFNATPAVKIIENHNGKAFIKSQFVPIQLPEQSASKPKHP